VTNAYVSGLFCNTANVDLGTSATPVRNLYVSTSVQPGTGVTTTDLGTTGDQFRALYVTTGRFGAAAAPYTNGGASCGTAALGWSSLNLKDSYAGVYSIQVDAGGLISTPAASLGRADVPFTSVFVSSTVQPGTGITNADLGTSALPFGTSYVVTGNFSAYCAPKNNGVGILGFYIGSAASYRGWNTLCLVDQFDNSKKLVTIYGGVLTIAAA
jgi:hypothetical protein